MSNEQHSVRKRKPSEDISSFVFGRIPPQSVDLEKAVLGAIMLEKDAINDVMPLLKPEVFYVESHSKICAAILKLKEKNIQIDIMTVANQLRSSAEIESVGGVYYIMELTNGVASAAHISDHIKIIYEHWQKREIIRIASELVRDAFDDTTDSFDLVDKAKKEITNIESPLFALSEETLESQIKRTMEIMANAAATKNDIIGVSTGLQSVDRVINGLLPGKLTIVGARSGMGKSSLALNMATYIANCDIPVDFYSLEEDDTDLIMKIISSQMNIHSYTVQRGRADWKELGNFQEAFQKKPLSIRDTTRMYLEDVCDRIRWRKKNRGVGIAFIDYLQLMQVRNLKSNANRENEVSIISRSLKATAKDSGVHIIAMSQLKKVIDERADPWPKLADLRESGSLENDADKVILIFRPEKHGILYDANGNSTHGVAFLDVAKNRGLETKQVRTLWTGSTMTFSDMPAGWTPAFDSTKVQKVGRGSKQTLIPLRDITSSEREEEAPPPANKDDLPF